MSLGEEPEPELEIGQLVRGEGDVLLLGTSDFDAEAETIEEVSSKGDDMGGMV